MTDPKDQAIRSAKSAADAAALWWVRTLMNPKLDNGTSGLNPNFDALVQHIEEGPHPHSEELAEFGRLLAEELEHQLENPRGYVPVYGIALSVDYHPDDTLAECAFHAGLPRIHWPWKTTMHVRPDAVEVSYGYGAQMVQIWPAE